MGIGAISPWFKLASETVYFKSIYLFPSYFSLRFFMFENYNSEYLDLKRNY